MMSNVEESKQQSSEDEEEESNYKTDDFLDKIIDPNEC